MIFNRSEVLVMARESGIRTHKVDATNFHTISTEILERYCQIVATKTMELAAQTCDDLWKAEADAAANGTQRPKYHDAIECAAAIRERSNDAVEKLDSSPHCAVGERQ